MSLRLLGTLLAANLVVPVASHATSATIQEKLGYPKAARLLILHADDLGMAHSVDTASFEALEKGWISSASVLVPCPWFPEVVRFAQSHPNVDLGVHLALNSEWTGFRWGPVSSRSDVPSLLDGQGYMPLVEEDVLLNARPAEVERELRAQIERTRAMGIRITHLDSHMGTLHRTPAFFSILRKLAHEAGLPYLVRPESPRPIPDDEVIAQEIVSMDPGIAKKDWFQEYKRQLQNLPPGIYQMTVHLAHDDDEMQGATYDHPD